MENQDHGLATDIGPIRVDWPRSAGYYGGIALAVAAGMIEPPLAVFVALIPFLKLLNRPNAPLPQRVISQVLDGASKPVGGDSEATITRVSDRPVGSQALLGGITGRLAEGTRGILADAQRLR